MLTNRRRSDSITPPLRRILDVIPIDRELALAEILGASGMRTEEAIPALARLVELGRVITRQERLADLFVRLYRQLRPEERVSETKVAYDGGGVNSLL